MDRCKRAMRRWLIPCITVLAFTLQIEMVQAKAVQPELQTETSQPEAPVSASEIPDPGLGTPSPVPETPVPEPGTPAPEPEQVYKDCFRRINGKLFYYNARGEIVKKRWKTINGKRYYFRKRGTAAVGCVKVKGVRYLFSSRGVLKRNGFKKYNGKRYYVDGRGRAAIGMKVIRGKTYNFKPSGVMRVGWWKKKGNTYYFSEKSGERLAGGWKKIKKKWYYFDDRGRLLTNQWIDMRYVGKNGAYQPNRRRKLAGLESKLRSMTNSYGGTWSVYVKNLDTGEYFSINNRQIYAASLIKLYAMGAAYQKIAEGKLKEASMSSTINSMITVSSNDAFNSVVRAVGTTYVNSWCRANGFKQTNQGHGLNPSGNNYGLSNGTGSNMTSVADCGKFLERVYRGTCVSRTYSGKMLRHLKGQTRRLKIPAGVPAGVTVANKTGETSSTTHDAAIVYSNGADYILCVMANVPGNAWGAAGHITTISRTVYDYLN